MHVARPCLFIHVHGTSRLTVTALAYITGAPAAWMRLLRGQHSAEATTGARMPLDQRLGWAERLGIIEPLVRRRGESDLSLDLRRGARERALRAVDAGRMRTMLGWAHDFVVGTGRESFFVDDDDDGGSRRGNAEVLDAFSEFMRRSGSKRKGSEGKLLKADGIQAIVAMARQLRELSTRGRIVDDVAVTTLGWGYRSMRREEPPSDSRRSRRALRASHLRRVAAGGRDRSSHQGRNDWAAALTGHNGILRGGELGSVEGRSGGFDAAFDMTWRSITWCLPNGDSRGRLWLILWVVPIKYRATRNATAHPIPIVRRQWGGTAGDDPLCAYDALWLHWLAQLGEPPVSARQDRQGRLQGGRLEASHSMAASPLFRGMEGLPWNTADTRRLARDIAAVCGEDPEEFGASSLRAGGATDIREILGDSSQEIIKQRGRWASDVAEIYQRALLRVQLDASGAMASAHGVDMEALCAGWSQPTSF